MKAIRESSPGSTVFVPSKAVQCCLGEGIGYMEDGIQSAVGRFGAVLQMRALPGRRDDLIRILTNYAGTLDGEPGTLLFAAAADPNDEDAIFLWEEFVDGDAVQAHFDHDFFKALQFELADLLAEPAAARPLVPIVRRVNPGVAAG